MKYFIYLFCISVIVACSQNGSEAGSHLSTDSSKNAEQMDTTSDSNNSGDAELLFEDTKIHAFSNSSSQDTFKLKVIGSSTNYQKAKISFSITSYEGKLIYEDSFEGVYLIDYGISELTDDPAKLTDQMRSDYIVKRLKSFFDEENFQTPAIKEETALDEHFPDRDLFNELKMNRNSVSFFYLLGEEDGKYIAFSTAKQKAVLFYNCC